MFSPLRLTLAIALVVVGSSAHAQLDLPKKTPAKPASGEGAGAAPTKGLDLPESGKEGEVDTPGAPAVTSSAASRVEEVAAIFAEVGRQSDPNNDAARVAVQRLGVLGEDAIRVSRSELQGGSPVSVAVAARVLLRYGQPADRRVVADRLQRALPSTAAKSMLGEFVATDPTLATTSYLVGLLEHPTPAMRRAAESELAARVTPADLPSLLQALDASRSSTRVAVLDLVSAIERSPARDPEDRTALNVLLASLDDRTSAVAERAARHLAGSNDPVAVARLRDLALDAASKGPSRAGAFATLALVAREDERREVLFAAEDAPALLSALADRSPIVAGAAAAALAGVGFRLESRERPAWVHRDVPYALIRFATGDVFHADFTALQKPGLERLALLSGESFGSSGPEWQAWWADNATSFRARRATIVLAPGDERGLRVRYVPASSSERAVVLLGSDLAKELRATVDADAVLLSDRASRDLLGALEAQGIFTAERIPGRRAATGVRVHELHVSIGSAEKAFFFPEGADQPWFTRSLEAVRSAARDHVWQRWVDPMLVPGVDERWLATSAFFDETSDPVLRARRLKDLILDRVIAARRPMVATGRDTSGDGEGVVQARRRVVDAGVAELARLAQTADVAEASDWSRLTTLLAQEPELGPPGSRARLLARLAIDATAALPEPSADASDAGTDADIGTRGERARDLFEVLVERHGRDALAELERVLELGGDDLVRACAADERAEVRAIVAGVLGRIGGADDADLLLALARDANVEVRIEALRAIGSTGATGDPAATVETRPGREAVLEALEADAPDERAAALRALGKLGGAGVREACVRGLSETDPVVLTAAAEALADLADPDSASLLAALFARGPDSYFHAPSRRGLLRIGAAAWPDLLRLATSGPRRVRREAAILLSEQGVSSAASTLMVFLTEDPTDARIAEELAILTCVDMRDEEAPADAWWNWWDLVVHDDSLAWLRGAASRAGFGTAPSGALEGEGTAEGARYLVRVAREAPEPLRTRALRELSRLLGEEVDGSLVAEQGEATSDQAKAAAVLWTEELERAIRARFGR